MLQEAGATPAQVVRTTVFLADLGDFQTVNELYAEVFGDRVSPHGPASRWPPYPRERGSKSTVWPGWAEAAIGLTCAADSGRRRNSLVQMEGPMTQAKLTIGELEAGYPLYCKALRRLLQQGKTAKDIERTVCWGHLETLNRCLPTRYKTPSTSWL